MQISNVEQVMSNEEVFGIYFIIQPSPSVPARAGLFIIHYSVLPVFSFSALFNHNSIALPYSDAHSSQRKLFLAFMKLNCC